MEAETAMKGSSSPAKGAGGTKRGGFRAANFVFLMTMLDNIGFVACSTSLVLYFLFEMHFDLAKSATTLTCFAGSTFLITILGGFIADSFLTKLDTILLFAAFEIMGYVLMTIQAQFKALRPPATCPECKLEGGNAAMFYAGLVLWALGFGGTRGAAPALGGDQFDNNHDDHQEEEENGKMKQQQHLASFFNYYMLSITGGALLGVTFVVWVATERSWALGFFISFVCASAGFSSVAAGKRFYRLRVASSSSSLVRISQVIVVAIRNRNVALPQEDLQNKNPANKETEMIPHTSQFRFLDKATVVADSSRNGAELGPWRVCTVTQVEELKILIRMLPILCSTIIMNTCLSQLQTFSVQQGSIMDRKLGGSFIVPASSITAIPLVMMNILIPLYELLVVPAVRRVTGHPNGITHLQRVGVGLVLSVVSMAIAAVVEVKRRRDFNEDGKMISLFWLGYQYGVFGIADMFTLVGLFEFFYSEAPESMRSLATSFSWLSLSFGYFLSSAVVNIINSVSGRAATSGHGWLYGVDLNKNRLDLFYWFLAVLSSINFVVYVLCARWY